MKCLKKPSRVSPYDRLACKFEIEGPMYSLLVPPKDARNVSSLGHVLYYATDSTADWHPVHE